MLTNEMTPEKRAWLDSARALIDLLEAHPLLIRTEGPFGTALEPKTNCTGHFREAVAALADAEDVTLSESSGNVYAVAPFGPHTLTAYALASEVCEEREVVRREYTVPTVAELTGVWSGDAGGGE